MASDWAAEAAGRIEALVGTVRTKTVDRLAVVVRIVVFGLVAATMGIVALALFVILAVRVLDTVLPRGVWVADAVLGLLFVATGLALWSKGRPRTAAGAVPPVVPVPGPSPTSTVSSPSSTGSSPSSTVSSPSDTGAP